MPPADSSQQVIIAHVVRGDSGVIIGAPDHATAMDSPTRDGALGNYYIHRLLVHHGPVPEGRRQAN